MIAKNEALIDRLTREKVSLINEIEDYKNKYYSFDSDTQQALIFQTKLYQLKFYFF